MRRVSPARPTCWLMGTLCRLMTAASSFLSEDMVLGMRPFDLIPELPLDPQLRIAMQWLEEREFDKARQRLWHPPPRGELAVSRAREAFLEASSRVREARACQPVMWHFMPGLRREKPKVDPRYLRKLREDGEQDEDASEAEVLQAAAARWASENLDRCVLAVQSLRRLAVAVHRLGLADEAIEDLDREELELLWASDPEDDLPR
jgi:hypothetical protein